MQNLHIRIVTILILSILVFSSLIINLNISALNADAMWIEPATLDYAGSPVGTKFNVTVWINMTTQTRAWQFRILYKKTHLNATNCGYTGVGKSKFFEGHATVPVSPVYGDFNSTHKYVMFGETLIASSENETGCNSLSWLEFQILPAYSYNCIIRSQLEYDVGATYVIKPDLSKVYPTLGKATYINTMHGPYMKNLYVKYYSSSNSLFTGLKNGQVDLTNVAWTDNQTQLNYIFAHQELLSAISPNSFMCVFDLNNNATTPTYRNWTNPTAYKKFRQGVACLVNKTYLINNVNYSCRIDTPIPRPIYDWWVDWSISQYDSYGVLLGNYPYEFSPSLAASYFNAAGFVAGNQNNTYYDPSFPNSSLYLRKHPVTGQTMQPIIMYIRNDDAGRLQAGRLLRDNLRKMGIPVNAIEASSATCRQKVMTEGDYHIYTGAWLFSSPLQALTIYTSAEITPSFMTNYAQFRNATYDEWCENASYAKDFSTARQAMFECQKILVKEAACIWLFGKSQVAAYRDMAGVANARGELLDNRWTFLHTHEYNWIRTTIYYGLQSAPTSLNVIRNYYYAGVANCLSNIYDTLLSYSPYDKTPGRGGEHMPWMAEDWEIGEWESPYNPSKNLTKLTFYLRDGIKWHDGAILNSSDVKFTIDYLKSLGSSTASLYGSVSDIHHVTTPDARTVFVYENVSSVWTLDYIGKLPILPKHIYQDITNVTGYTPGAGQGVPASQSLIGSGPWKYVFYNSTTLYLEANRGHFMETPLFSEIDYRYDWEMGNWIVDGMDSTMLMQAYSGSGLYQPSANWEPGCDLDGNGIVDPPDLSSFNYEFNKSFGRSIRRSIPTPFTDSTLYVQQSGSVLVGQNLTASVRMDNIDRLDGVQFKVYYDNTKLNCLKLTVNKIFGLSWTQIFAKKINQTMGYIWVAVSSNGPSINGSEINVADIVFNATKPSGSTLDLQNTLLAKCGIPRMTSIPMAHKALDKGVMVGISTPTGGSVTVAPAPSTKVTFAQVTTEGVTTLNITQSPSFEFVSVLCHEIKTTSIYTGNIDVQFTYNTTALSLEDEQNMKIWLWNDTSEEWLDITTFVNTTSNIVYGTAPHLSMFGVTADLSLIGELSEEGSITATTPTSPPNLPGGLVPLKLYDIETDKTVLQWPVTVRMAYDAANIPPEEERFVKMWLWDSTSWKDITDTVDTTGNVVYGKTSHWSMFGVTRLPPAPPPQSGVFVYGANCSGKTVVCKGYNVTVNVVTKNGGDFTANFTVNVYANSTLIGTRSIVNLAPGKTNTTTFKYNTANLAKGNYTIGSCGERIGYLIVSMVGDITSELTGPYKGWPDKRCDMSDMYPLCKLFGVFYPDPKYKPNYDIDNNKRIDMGDIYIAAKQFGKMDP